MKKSITFVTFTLLTATILKAQEIHSLTSTHSKNMIVEISPNTPLESTMATTAYFNKNNIPNAAFLNKSRKQKTAAWILLSGGLITTGVGVVLASTDAVVTVIDAGFNGNSTMDPTGPIISVTGLAMMAGSIPLFIAGAKNKRKAFLSVDKEKVGFGIPDMHNKSITGIKLTIGIGK